MSAYPLPPTHLLTVDEYLALGEDDRVRFELTEGNLAMSPSPSVDHNEAASILTSFIRSQVPDHLGVVHDVDVDLELALSERPGTVRRPDVLLYERAARERVRREGGCLRASDVLLAVEIVSPGSWRTDHVMKRSEYADAGIPWYWIVDVDDPVSVLVYRLTDQFGYCEEQTATGTLVTERPFPMEIDLTKLR